MAEWVTIGSDVMRGAMAEQGLSAERAARMVPVTEKTWRRWMDRGQVQRRDLPRVAEILNLEIETPVRRSISVPELAEVDGGLMAKLTEVLTRLDRIEKAVLQDDRSAPKRRRASR